MLSYLKFLMKSTNEHGVHSPFVYNYLTKSLYTKPRLSKDKVEDVLLKTIAYFDYKKIWIENEELKTNLSNDDTMVNDNGKPWDLVFFEEFNFDKVLKMIHLENVHNNSVFLVRALKKNRSEWIKATAHPKITVSIDGYLFGLLFIRKEQAKEHFTIRF